MAEASQETRPLSSNIGNATEQPPSNASEHLSAPPDLTAPPIVFSNRCQAPLLFFKWPKIKTNVPSIFLHYQAEIEDRIEEVLSLGIKFYKPIIRQFYTKLVCFSKSDYNLMINFLNSHNAPYHTYGHAVKNVFKFVIKGLPENTECSVLKKTLRAASIPVKTVYKMQRNRAHSSKRSLIIDAPNVDDCKKLFWIKSVFGYNVTFEQIEVAPKQCIRCLRWGHSHFYCRGKVKCVKCGGEHPGSWCTLDLTICKPRCANCWGAHTADFRDCYFCPTSKLHRSMELDTEVTKHSEANAYATPVLVTFEKRHELYANLRYR